MPEKLRVLYAAGPGDVIGTYEYWSRGQDDPSRVSITYSGQFYEVCSDLNAETYVISSHPECKVLKDGRFTLEHRPNPLQTKSGLQYHLGQLRYGLGLIRSAMQFKADVVILSDMSHYFVMSLLPKVGIQVVPSLHCTLWCKYLPVSRTQKLLAQLNRSFFAEDCSAILAISEDVVEQVKQITQHQPKPIKNFLPAYRRAEFAAIQAPQPQPPLHVLFVGRIEQNKGAFDLLEIHERLLSEGRNDIVFHLCGDGSGLEELQQEVTRLGFDSTFICHGYCQKEQMRQMYNLAHVVIVPTRTNFTEGLNKVVVEGILAGRPVITSAVCPALSYVRDAVVEVPPDDVAAYGDAILKLCDDKDLYEQKRENCLALQEQFYDPACSWGEALKSVLVSVQNS
ncbi:MAG: glycosyltransferase family 4 protein [Cyanobacteria bacterium RM1_2_2]|nr:glycosyltransferase family 4 protein [Cyanobacteria bacterium RM1_2_2]